MFVTSKQVSFVALMWGQQSFEARFLTGTSAPVSQCSFFAEINEMATYELSQLLHTFLSEQKLVSYRNCPKCLFHFVPPHPRTL